MSSFDQNSSNAGSTKHQSCIKVLLSGWPFLLFKLKEKLQGSFISMQGIQNKEVMNTEKRTDVKYFQYTSDALCTSISS